jgi:hypothetical protein
VARTSPSTASEQRCRTDMGMNADDVYEALKGRHPLPEWVLVRELQLGTAFEMDEVEWEKWLAGDCWERRPRYHMLQRIDAYALNCHKSKQFRRIAYEIKVNHADFIREKIDPDKRRPAQKVSDYFYFAAPRGIIAPEEVPDDCGLVVVYENGRSRILKRAPRLEPERLDWQFVASLVRNITQARMRDLPKDRYGG